MGYFRAHGWRSPVRARLFDFDPRLGVRTSVTGPDGLNTSYQYDAFGRMTLEDRPAGTTNFYYRACASGGCFPQHAAFYVQAADSTGATSYSFFDELERPVGSDAPLAGGQRSRDRTEYLANGRVQISAARVAHIRRSGSCVWRR